MRQKTKDLFKGRILFMPADKVTALVEDGLFNLPEKQRFTAEECALVIEAIYARPDFNRFRRIIDRCDARL